ncbi:MAG: L,D-transpeptidase family protein [Azoarcus sp.]|jgi:D-alanyl-D-alanine dipeptidase/L,D-peptidoglycan transpeptidase YkuD (ErfK/YbiS/YcfS/YnhG family)|nr:L,D-transpeptidase family protein [Azoarcus sp.]
MSTKSWARRWWLWACVALVSLHGAAWAREVAPAVDTSVYPPSGFVFVRDAVADAVLDVRYAGADNFVAARIDGYEADEAILSVEAAVALRAVTRDLRAKGYCLKIFDAYRPASAVRHFVRWAEDLADTRNQATYYPGVDKAKLFELGYVARRSGHSRGSTVDLTLVDAASGAELDMGSHFDFFNAASHHDAAGVTAAQAANRALLRDAMEARGFKRLKEEWWHYTLKSEPYPSTYFEFPVAAPRPVDEATRTLLEAKAGGAGKALVVTADAAAPQRATLRAYARADGVWTLRFTTPVWLGRSGFRPDKREGDGGTPTGVYTFTRAFGVAPDPGSTLPYTQVSAADVWVDDPASRYYNQWARSDYPDADWRSAERLANFKDAYKHALVIAYNVAPTVPGKGSAIFLHVSTGRPTAGCVAVPEAALVFLLGFVAPDTRIVLAP